MGSLTAYLYGVFPTQGFPNDTLYPFTYRLGEVVLENIGCLDGDKVQNKAHFLVLSLICSILHAADVYNSVGVLFNFLFP
jgi:hypothetical protein